MLLEDGSLQRKACKEHMQGNNLDTPTIHSVLDKFLWAAPKFQRNDEETVAQTIVPHMVEYNIDNLRAGSFSKNAKIVWVSEPG